MLVACALAGRWGCKGGELRRPWGQAASFLASLFGAARAEPSPSKAVGLVLYCWCPRGLPSPTQPLVPLCGGRPGPGCRSARPPVPGILRGPASEEEASCGRPRVARVAIGAERFLPHCVVCFPNTKGRGETKRLRQATLREGRFCCYRGHSRRETGGQGGCVRLRACGAEFLAARRALHRTGPAASSQRRIDRHRSAVVSWAPVCGLSAGLFLFFPHMYISPPMPCMPLLFSRLHD